MKPRLARLPLRSAGQADEGAQSGTLYLLHFSEPLAHSQHYIGWTGMDSTVKRRLARHRKGRGAAITAAASAKGIKLRLVRVWEGSCRNFERRLKKARNHSRLCPVCNPRLRQLSDER